MKIERVVTEKFVTNCYLLSGDGFAAVIDPGEEMTEISEFVTDNISKPQKLIILTHCHFDHIGGVNFIRNKWNCPILASLDEKEGLNDNRINLSGYWTADEVSIIPDITVSDGDEFKLGTEIFKVISTAGHTKGSVCYLCGDTLFSGDTLFRASCGRTDLPTGSTEEMMRSLRKLSLLDDNVTVLTGHGEQTNIDYERSYNPYLK